MTETIFRELRECAASICHEAGQMAEEAFHQEKNIRFKSGNEIVTDTDEAVERFVRDAINKRYPDHRVIGEEHGSSGSEDADFTWYIDPVDGTRNFAHGIPHFNVSLGVMHEGDPVAGAVADPMHKKLFTAHRGGGAECNGNAIHVSKVTDLNKAMIIIDYQRSGIQHLTPEFMWSLFRESGKLRLLGAIALDLCYVASGRCDAILTIGNPQYNLVDVTAGMCILREAGSGFENLRREEFDWDCGTVIAGNPELVTAILAAFQEKFEAV